MTPKSCTPTTATTMWTTSSSSLMPLPRRSRCRASSSSIRRKRSSAGSRVMRSPQRRRPSSLKRQARAYPPQRRHRSTSIWRFRGTAPDRVTHRIVYAIKPDAPLASIVGTFSISGPEVQVNRAPAITIRPPLTGKGWWAANGCCAPNAHRDTRIAIDGSRIETPEAFAIDWTQLKDGKTFEGDGARNEEHYAFGADVLAVADGTVVSVRDGMPEETPSKPPVAVHAPGDYGGNYVILQLAANVYAAYAHMQPGSISVKPGERARGGD